MQSSIRNIRTVYKYGAFGDPDSLGVWVYGRRPDGRTVACKNKSLDGGGIRIWSTYWRGDEVFEPTTEFSEDEWRSILHASQSDQRRLSNKILDARKKEPSE